MEICFEFVDLRFGHGVTESHIRIKRSLSRRPGKIVRHNMGNQRFNFFSQLGIAAAGLIEKGRAVRRVALERRGEYPVNFFPALRFHIRSPGIQLAVQKRFGAEPFTSDRFIGNAQDCGRLVNT